MVKGADLGRIGRYRLLQLVSEGGMGRVYRAFDEQMQRYVALKQIKASLLSSERAKLRFLHEARLTASLNHPSIIPIFEISKVGGVDYYTMPFVQGTNLKDSLRSMKHRGEDLHIMACTRIFTSICQAVAHAHSSGILHRDIKAENIMLGQYEQVLILDWGLACWKGHTPTDDDGMSSEISSGGLRLKTQFGKVVGTLAYLPYERLKGAATEQSDIYSLGVLLYLMLTYQLPFKRKTAREFRMSSPQYPPDPRQVVPHRDIPETLVRIINNALHPDPKRRYENSYRLVEDLQTFLEGRSTWYLLTKFCPAERSQWSIQENIFIERWPIEVNSMSQASWALLMVSKPTTSGNFRIETSFLMRRGSKGLGLLFNLPDMQGCIQPLVGFLLWVSGPEQGGICLCRDGTLLVDAPHIQAQIDVEHTIRIEKIENRISCSFDAVPCIAYVSTLPLVGALIGLIQEEGGPEIRKIDFYAGGLSLRVSCLAVPDHFLANCNYARALAEYRRISLVFCGYSEGQKAQFLAGITLLEISRRCALRRDKNSNFRQALDEFERLRSTPSAPLEWLGKALTYRFWNLWEEEANCLELGCLRYPTNPKIRYLREEVISQLFFAMGNNRKLAARLVLLLVRTLPCDLYRSDTFAQIQQLRLQLALPPHLALPQAEGRDEGTVSRWQLGLEMIFSLWQPQTLIDSTREIVGKGAIPSADIFYTLQLMGVTRAKAALKIEELENSDRSIFTKIPHFDLYKLLRSNRFFKKTELYLQFALKNCQDIHDMMKPLFVSASCALNSKQYAKADALFELTLNFFPNTDYIWQWVEIKALILLARGDRAKLHQHLLRTHNKEDLQTENHPLFPVYASCQLLGSEPTDPTFWTSAQFARRFSTRLIAQCINLVWSETAESQVRGLKKVRSLANGALAMEKKRAYHHLRSLFSGLNRLEEMNMFRFLLRS